ncbi:hypothetical protein O181_025996 [Austropuccinia psidii MF-1]|uniref:Reverse transcriptase RNase H-like domain-containing protein n=1 Tax=Austropuccinia psidii MF-1 TaxID=1389203 RepID=A0A9Q3H034_9BASI|nr:hypothetical protein [Austropuccinia psidii MF-1]
MGYVVTGEGLRMDSSKVQKISIGLSQRTSRHFNLSLAFSTSIVVSLKIIPKNSLLSLLSLKEILPSSSMRKLLVSSKYSKKLSSLLLSYPISILLPITVATDASNYSLVAILSQVNHSTKHPIAFESGKLLPAMLNYEIHDKDLLGIVWALKHWRAFLLSLYDSFAVLTDHSSLQYFMSSKVLTCRQAR